MTFLSPQLMFLLSLLALALANLPVGLSHSEDHDAIDAKILLPFEKLEQGMLNIDGSDRFKNADFKILSTERNDFMSSEVQPQPQVQVQVQPQVQRSLALMMKRMNLAAKQSPALFSDKLTTTITRKHGRRHLLGTVGHLSEILFNGCSASDVYSDTTYDDMYAPVCRCLQDQVTGEVFLTCYLGDETCSAGSSGDSQVCTGTHEVFYFADSDGDLDTKSSCTFCRSDNCEGVREICTRVAFDANDEPERCSLVEFFQETNSTTTQASDPIRCQDCEICGTAAAGFGIQHSCFKTNNTDDGDDGGCNKDAFAHLHHFVPAPIDRAPVGGEFLQTCSSSTSDRDLYSTVSYADTYSAICDCDDPASGTITCDLHDSQCFANLCTEISEVFFFSADTGQYEAKWTFNFDTNFWTQTDFNPATGGATECLVFGTDPASGDLVACTACDICDTAQDGKGITHTCFGGADPTPCDASDGRAKFNFPIPARSPTVPDNSSPTTSSPTAPSTTTTTDGISNSQQEDWDKNTLPLIMGIAFGGLAVIAIIVVVVQRRHVSPAELVAAENLTLAESTMDPIETEAGEPQFTIDNNDEEMTLGSSVAPPPSEMDAEAVVGSATFEDGEMA